MINASKILAIITPFVIVGSILAWYNYVRFDSLFEFGFKYQMLSINNGSYSNINIIGKIHSYTRAFLFILFNPPNLDLIFPFITEKFTNIGISTTYMFKDLLMPSVGIFCFPFMWFLFSVKKVNILRNFIFAGIFISSLNIILIAVVSRSWRYNMDFFWIMAIGALICAFKLQEKDSAMRKVILKVFYFCCILTLLLGFFLTISYHKDSLEPKTYHYLARTFGVICNVRH